MYFLHIAFILPVIIFLQLAFWVFYIDRHSTINRLCTVICVLMASETIVEYYYINSKEIAIIKFAVNIDTFIWGLLAPTVLYFAIALSEHPVLKKTISKILILIGFLPTILFPLFEFHFVKDNNFSNWSSRETFDGSSPFFIYYSFVSLLSGLLVLYLLYYSYKISINYRIQKQAKLILQAYFISSFFYLPWIISMFFEFPTHPLLLTYALVIVMTVTVYSISRYRAQSLTTSRMLMDMIEHSSEFTLIINPMCIVLSANKQVAKFLGLEKYELEGKDFTEIIDDNHLFSSELKRMEIRTTYSPQLDLTIKTKDGGLKNLKSGINAIRNQFNEVLGYHIIFFGSSEEVQSIDRIKLKYELSDREKEVALFLVKGLSNQQIADNLFISLATVKTHSHNIYSKTFTKNKSELRNLLHS